MNIQITLSNGKIKEYSKGISIEEVAKDISISLHKEIVYAIVNDNKVNIKHKLQNNVSVKLITIANQDNEIDQEINLACAKMIKKILTKHFTNLVVVNISANNDYFFIDIDNKNPIKESELLILNNKIWKYSKQYEIDSLQLIMNKKHFANFKFVSVSGVYLDNNKTNKMVSRIIGLASYSAKHLQEKEQEINQRLEFDHRVIGNKMKLFTFSNMVGPGLPIWLPNGVILKNQIRKFLAQKELEYEYCEVETPILGNLEMYNISGHLSHYKDTMFSPIKTNSEQLVLRPMSCPHHIAVFKNELYSYRDLPIRLSEHAHLFRYEPSGSLTGLERVRMMHLTDAHIFIRLDQLKQEFKNCFKLITEVLKEFKIEIFYFSLSVRDKNDKVKYFNDDKMWEFSENMLKQCLEELNIEYKLMVGEAAFYGPKLDIQIQSVLKHEITVSTIQLDMIGAKNFAASYIDEKSQKVSPIIIHRGLVGTYERFISILLEQTKGNLPLWLCPEQVRIIPVNDKILDYCFAIKAKLIKNNIRVKIDQSNERLNYKIRNAQINKIPYQLILGEQEKNKNNLAFRKYASDQTQFVMLNDFIDSLKHQIKTRK